MIAGVCGASMLSRLPRLITLLGALLSNGSCTEAVSASSFSIQS